MSDDERPSMYCTSSSRASCSIAQEARHIALVGGIPAEGPVVAQRPQIAARDAGCGLCFLESGVQIEVLWPLTLLAGVQGLEELRHLVLTKARERQVGTGAIELGKHPGEQLLIPLAGDLVQGEVEQLGLFWRQVEEDIRYGFQSQLARRQQPLVSTDHYSVIVSGDDRVDEAELQDAAGERLELGVADTARVGRVGVE